MKKGDLVLVSHIFIDFSGGKVLKKFTETYGVVAGITINTNLVKVFFPTRRGIEEIHTCRIRIIG